MTPDLEAPQTPGAPLAPLHEVTFRVNDARRDYPTHTIRAAATAGEIEHFVRAGYLIRHQLISRAHLEALRTALDEVAAAELDHGSGGCHGGQYLRYLMDKHPLFLDLFKLESTLSIARAVLGPEVQFDQVDARVVPGNVAGQAVPWHIHFRVVPDPLPPFFCYPHAVHCLLYLDDVDESNGQLCVLPGSHHDHQLAFPDDDYSDKPGQVALSLPAGSCFLMHCNLWHKTQRSRAAAGPRRLLIFGYMPSWMRGDESGGVKPIASLREEFLRTADQRTRRLLGEFQWG